MYRIVIQIIILLCSGSILAQEADSLHNKYINYRDRLLKEWIIISPNVEQFGTNIPAVDRKRYEGSTIWVSWSDGNSNFNHWLGILSTEYKLLKINNQDYKQTLKMLLYSMIAIERLDLYSEYALRKEHNKDQGIDSDIDLIRYPEDINGFMIRDDVSLGFWKQYHNHFTSVFGNYTDRKDGTEKYMSVFQRGVIPKQGMSQDNICYMLQGLALVKHLVDDESIKGIEINFQNPFIPDYLKSKNIMVNDSVYFGTWAKDISERLVNHCIHKYPEQKIALKPFKSLQAEPTKNELGGLVKSSWYILNPVTNDFVAEGNGEDMGVMINSYGIAEAGNAICEQNKFHYNGSGRGFKKYLFKSVLFKNFRILKFGGITGPENFNDYMFRSLATISDINWNKNSYDLLFLLDDKRPKFPYEHNTLILVTLHDYKYKNLYKPGYSLFENDRKYYSALLSEAPFNGPHSNYNQEDYSINWSSSSRLNWPKHEKNQTKDVNWDFAGLDYMFLYNLYRLTFESENYNVDNTYLKSLEFENYFKYKTPELENQDEIKFFYMPPKLKMSDSK